jgi:hypothetical protein
VTPTTRAAVFVPSVTLEAVMVYVPAKLGAVYVTAAPLCPLDAENVPHALALQFEALADHLTPAGSFVVGVMERAWEITRPARRGETETEIVGTMVRFMPADLVRAGLLESVTVKVSAAGLAVAVGVPVMAPEVAFSDRPAGRIPLVKDQL